MFVLFFDRRFWYVVAAIAIIGSFALAQHVGILALIFLLLVAAGVISSIISVRNSPAAIAGSILFMLGELLCWLPAFFPSSGHVSAGTQFVGGIGIAILFFLTGMAASFYFRCISEFAKDDNPANATRWSISFILLGFIAVFLGGLFCFICMA